MNGRVGGNRGYGVGERGYWRFGRKKYKDRKRGERGKETQASDLLELKLRTADERTDGERNERTIDPKSYCLLPSSSSCTIFSTPRSSSRHWERHRTRYDHRVRRGNNAKCDPIVIFVTETNIKCR